MIEIENIWKLKEEAGKQLSQYNTYHDTTVSVEVRQRADNVMNIMMCQTRVHVSSSNSGSNGSSSSSSSSMCILKSLVFCEREGEKTTHKKLQRGLFASFFLPPPSV
jgi:hypothetical protein